jgi:hypothetical protein
MYIYNYSDKKINIINSYQSEQMMKFDFSISDIKKLEIKSTIKEDRIHKFRHEQLTTNLFDIIIASVLLRRDDEGLSLLDLVEMILDLPDVSPGISRNILTFLGSCGIEDLNKHKYSEQYCNEHIAYYRAEDVPHIEYEIPIGITDISYSVDLISTPHLEIGDLINWFLS